MMANKFILNQTKTLFLLLGNSRKLKNLNGLDLSDCVTRMIVELADSACGLGLGCCL